MRKLTPYPPQSTPYHAYCPDYLSVLVAHSNKQEVLISTNSSNALSASLNGLGKIAALVAAVFLTPALHDLTFSSALAAFQDIYGHGYNQLAGWAWLTACGLTIYFVIQAMITILITIIAVRTAGR